MKHELQLKGRSGCEIILKHIGDQIVVRKYSNGISYNTRLLEQVSKQSAFKSINKLKKFEVPNILLFNKGNDSELAFLDMEFVYAQKYSDYLEQISVPELKRLGEEFKSYFNQLLSLSTLEQVDFDIISDKLNSLREKLLNKKEFDQELLSALFTYLEKPPADEILTGYCHGDFTFSNILFDKEKLYLIDFLDCFIESPIQDFVKFRQDSKFFWSMLLENNMPSYKQTKVKQVLTYLDSIIEDMISNNKEVQQWYTYMQAFNLLRILPYLDSKSEIEFVEKSLKNTIQ